MTQLRVIGRYRTSSVDYPPGMVLDLRPEEAELLLRDSPGSFQSLEAGAPVATEPTASGLNVPDRRARSGFSR